MEPSLNAELTHGNMERAFVKPAGLAPVKQHWPDLLLEKPEIFFWWIMMNHFFDELKNLRDGF